MSLFALAVLSLLLLLLVSRSTSTSSWTSLVVGAYLDRAPRTSSLIRLLCRESAPGQHQSSPNSRSDGHSLSPSQSSHSSPRRTDVLFLDEHLTLLAIRESCDLLSLILSHSASHSSLHRLAAQCRVRLIYCLLRAPVPDLERDQLLALHRHDQDLLARTLDSHSALTSSTLRRS